MRLERDPLFRTSRTQSTETRDGRVPAIGGHEGSSSKRFMSGGDRPVIRARVGGRKRGDRDRFKDRRAEFARAIEKQLVEEAPLDRDLRFVTYGQVDCHAASADSDKLDTIQLSVGQTSNALPQFQAPQDRPASGIQAVAANFLARKFFSFEDHCSQTGGRAKGRAARPSRAAANDRDIEHAGLSSSAAFFAGGF